jgi:hypothetical protein
MRIWTAVVALFCAATPAFAGCGDRKDGSPPPEASKPALAAAPSAAPEPPPPPPAPAREPTAAEKVVSRPDPPGFPKEGWSKQVMVDAPALPLCVFSDYKTQWAVDFAKDAKKQKLSVDQPLVVGAYAPHCINEACDDVPSLQCQAKLEGNTVTVHTRFVTYHKEGASCDKDCGVVKAACATPNLPAGEYVIQHGELAAKVKIPSVQRAPCLKLQPIAK